MGKNKGKKEKKAKKTAERKEKPKTGKVKVKATANGISDESEKKEFSAAPVQHTQPKKQPPKRPDDAFTQKMLIIFQALSDENRLKIMNLLAEQERSTPELLESIGIVQSTMSHHMKVLSEAGLVQSRRAGKRFCYSVRKDMLEQAAAYFESLRRQ
ncbi:MAG: metalloregulator ArsR/SmtB family transcription factor [Lachnospiraceae bacterium]|nr:metalloregulator ArsR/SmtB family transcription factor [Lachnospiraceae bacterium]